MGDKTDVNVETDAIQDHETEQVTISEQDGDLQPELESVENSGAEEKEVPAFVSERDRLAEEMLNRQRDERNADIARELGLENHPNYQKKTDQNIEENDEINNVDNVEQEETEEDEEEQLSEENIPEETEKNEPKLDQTAQDVDQTTNDDLKLNKPGFYGNEVVLKVDGQLVSMPAEKALSILQKNQAADKRLENIVLRERQVTLKEEQLRQHINPQPSEVKQPDVVEDADIEKRARTIVQSVEDGEQEKAVESLVSLVKDTVGRHPETQPTLTPEQITQLVYQRSKEVELTAVESRLKTSGNYDDIFDDPIAYSIAVQNVQYLSASGYEGSPEQIMVEALEMERDWRSGLSREQRLNQTDQKPVLEPKLVPKKSPTISEEQRLKKKRESARPVKSTTTIQRKAATQPEAEPSERDKFQTILAKQRAVRGQ